MFAVKHGFFSGVPYVELRCGAGHAVFWGEPGSAYAGGPLWWRLKSARREWWLCLRHGWWLAKYTLKSVIAGRRDDTDGS